MKAKKENHQDYNVDHQGQLCIVNCNNHISCKTVIAPPPPYLRALENIGGQSFVDFLDFEEERRSQF